MSLEYVILESCELTKNTHLFLKPFARSYASLAMLVITYHLRDGIVGKKNSFPTDRPPSLDVVECAQEPNTPSARHESEHPKDTSIAYHTMALHVLKARLLHEPV